MKTLNLLSLLLLLCCTSLLAAPPQVVSIIAPDVDTASYGYNGVSVVVTYGKASAGDLAVDPETIGIDDLRVILTTPSPKYSYLAGTRLQVQSATAEPAGENLVVTYLVSPHNPGWDPRFSGTYTITLQADQVGTLPHPETSIVEYAPETELATFSAAIADVRAEVKGRIWNDTGANASFVDEGHTVDPGISDWNLFVDMWDAESNLWTTAADFTGDYDYTFVTRWDGSYIIRYLPPGDYRIYAWDLPVELSSQALGDPTRGGIMDGYYHFSIQPEDDGNSLTVNLVYREETASPHPEHDAFEIGWKTVDVRLDVLANDTVDPPLGHEDLRIVGLNGRPSSLDVWKMASMGSWGGAIRSDGRFVYYTPPSPDFWGREIEFAYKISDGQGNFDIERVWVKVVKTPTNPFEALDDFAEVSSSRQTYEIHVLLNDVIFPPHEYADVVVSVDPTSASGAQLEVTPDKSVVYHLSEGFLGTDTFSYTIESPLGDIRTAEVIVEISQPGIQNDPYEGRNLAIAVLLSKTPEGRRFLYFYGRFIAEIYRIMTENAVAQNASVRGVLREGEVISPLDIYLPSLNNDLSQLFLGNGDSAMLSWEGVEELKTVATLLKTVGSPELRMGILLQEAAIPGGLDGLYGLTVTQFVTAFGADVTAMRVEVYEPTIRYNGFSMKTLNVIGQSYSLWKTSSLENGSWVEISDAVVSVDGPYVILTDPNPDSAHTFYRIQASVDALP